VAVQKKEICTKFIQVYAKKSTNIGIKNANNLNPAIFWPVSCSKTRLQTI
jgi:hypothetical protein